MPEGHTLRRLADDLDEAFGRRRIRVSSPGGRSAADAAVVDGEELVRADSAGKLLFLEFPGERFLHVHLGLIGRFDVHPATGSPAEVPEPVGVVRLRLVGPDGAYADLRGAITADLIDLTRRDALLEGLGPDPLRADADPLEAWTRISRSSRPIAALLMDQSVVAGVGNVYRAEVLFRHRVDPYRPGRSLRRSTWLAMWADLVTLMREGVRSRRIDTVRAEHTPEATGRAPRVDDHGGEVYVYRRAGMPCHVCGGKVRTAALGGRNLFWCPRCQPRFRSRARAGGSATGSS